MACHRLQRPEKQAVKIPANPWLAKLVTPFVNTTQGVSTFKPGVHLARAGAAGAGNAAAWGYALNPNVPEGGVPLLSGHWDNTRRFNTLLNAALGAGGYRFGLMGAQGRARATGMQAKGDADVQALRARGMASVNKKTQVRNKAGEQLLRDADALAERTGKLVSDARLGAAGLTTLAGSTIGSSILKDVLINTRYGFKALTDMADGLKSNPNKAVTQVAAPGQPGRDGSPGTSTGGGTAGNIVAGALIAAGLGGAAYAIQKAVKDKADAPINITTQEGGRLKVHLPTRGPNDNETIVDLPYDPEEELSTALRKRITLDTKRRLRGETQQRIRHTGTALNLNL